MVAQKIVLKYPLSLVDRPIVCQLARQYDLEFNILRASFGPSEEGLLVLEIKGTESACRAGLKYLTEMGLDVQPLSRDILRNEARCTDCGACVSVCPSGALVMDRRTMEVVFENDKCIACELCIRACPIRAMDLHF